MKAQVPIIHISHINIEGIKKAIDIGNYFEFEILINNYADKGKQDIGIWLSDSQCRINTRITKESAIFLGKSLIALAESIK